MNLRFWCADTDEGQMAVLKKRVFNNKKYKTKEEQNAEERNQSH